MKRRKGGFTIIEVSLFLAITGALFVAVTIGVQNSIFQQRYNDSVQDFAEFLRRVYAETMNVQNNNDGRSNQAIYGKLVTFGETTNLTGASNTDNEAFMYDVVGDVRGDIGTGNVLSAMGWGSGGVHADVIVDDGAGGKKPAGIVESYRPKWSTQIQPPCSNSDCYKPFVGAILVIRHPRSGTVYTYTMSGETVEVNKKIAENKGLNNNYSVLESYLNSDKFKIQQFDMCVNPNGEEVNNNRADVRIEKNARNTSAIEIIFDQGVNNCRTS